LFNLSTTVIGVTVAYNPTHFQLADGLSKLPSMIPMAAFLYFLANTGLVSGMIALSEDLPFQAVWRNMSRQILAYFMVGGFVATLIIVTSRVWGWESGILVLPLLYLTYRTYRTYMHRRYHVLRRA